MESYSRKLNVVKTCKTAVFLAPYTTYIIVIQNKFYLENGFIFASFDGDGIPENVYLVVLNCAR